MLSNLFIGAVGMFLFFGDRALRELWHFSFGASIMVWIGVLTTLVIAAIFISDFLDN